MTPPSVGPFERWLLRDGPPQHLAAIRIAVGCYAVGWLAVIAPELAALGDLDRARYDPVGLVALLGLGPPAPGTIRALIVITIVAGCAFVAGWRYRATAPIFATGLLLLTTYQNSWSKLLHTENLLVLHVLVLAVSPAADAFTVPRRQPGRPSKRYGWPVRVLAIATLGAYLVAGVTKLRYSGGAWLDPENLRNWVAYDLVRKELFGDPYLPVARPILEHVWLFAPAMVFTLVVELGAPAALLARRIAWIWAGAAWTLHVAVLTVMAVAFPYQLSGIALAPVLLAAPRSTRHDLSEKPGRGTSRRRGRRLVRSDR